MYFFIEEKSKKHRIYKHINNVKNKGVVVRITSCLRNRSGFK